MNIIQLFTQDERTRQTREQHYACCITDRCSQGGKPCPTPDQCVISLDTSWLGRFLSWVGRWA